MKKKILSGLLILSAAAAASIALLSGCAGERCSFPTHWDYTEVATWGELDTDYETCSTGTAQSPIDITSASTTGATNTLSTSYSAATDGEWKIVNNGHTVEVKYPAGNTLTIGGTTYELAQFHFHTTSEHTINGTSYPMEMHLVHSNSTTGKNAVIGILFDTASIDDSFISGMLSAMTDSGVGASTGGWATTSDTLENFYTCSHNEVDGVGTINVADLMTSLSAAGYYNYSGSLTTPPCTESVENWIVMDAPLGVSSTTVANLLSAIGGHTNNRPVQNLNGRTVYHAP